MRDVEYALVRDSWVFKALTPKAIEAMGADAGLPWQMAAAVFWQDVEKSRFEITITKLHGLGLQTEPDPVSLAAYTDF